MSRRIVRTLADIHRADLAPVTTNRATLTLLAFRLSRSRSSRLVKQYPSARSGRDSVFLRPTIQVQSSSLVIDLVATCNELVHPFLTLDGGFHAQVGAQGYAYGFTVDTVHARVASSFPTDFDMT